MPSHTETERAKRPKKAKTSKKQPKKTKKAKRVASMAEQMGWTSDTENIVLRGSLQPSFE